MVAAGVETGRALPACRGGRVRAMVWQELGTHRQSHLSAALLGVRRQDLERRQRTPLERGASSSRFHRKDIGRRCRPRNAHQRMAQSAARAIGRAGLRRLAAPMAHNRPGIVCRIRDRGVVVGHAPHRSLLDSGDAVDGVAGRHRRDVERRTTLATGIDRDIGRRLGRQFPRGHFRRRRRQSLLRLPQAASRGSGAHRRLAPLFQPSPRQSGLRSLGRRCAAFRLRRPGSFTTPASTTRFSNNSSRIEPPPRARAALAARGITHVYVDWSEIARYRRTYGYSQFIQPDVFDRLVSGGVISPLPDIEDSSGKGYRVVRP